MVPTGDEEAEAGQPIAGTGQCTESSSGVESPKYNRNRWNQVTVHGVHFRVGRGQVPSSLMFPAGGDPCEVAMLCVAGQREPSAGSQVGSDLTVRTSAIQRPAYAIPPIGESATWSHTERRSSVTASFVDVVIQTPAAPVRNRLRASSRTPVSQYAESQGPFLAPPLSPNLNGHFMTTATSSLEPTQARP